MLGALCSSAGRDVEKERLLSNQPGELRDSVLSAGLTVRACMGNIEYVNNAKSYLFSLSDLLLPQREVPSGDVRQRRNYAAGTN